MRDEGNNNTLAGLAIGFGVLLLAWLIATLLDSKSGEQAAALGAVVGGIVGAGGAVLAVYLTLSRQRREDILKVRAAVRTEISTYAKYVIGALDICQQIETKAFTLSLGDAGYIAKNLVDPVIYPAVADRIALLKRPQATIEFYMRVQEVKAVIRAMVESVAGLTQAQSYMMRVHPFAIADSLITALQLAEPIIQDDDGLSSQMEFSVRDVVLQDIANALQTAQTVFPKAKSFQTSSPPSAA